MATDLTDLFSASSPPPELPAPAPPRSPSPSFRADPSDPLFFSPGDTPDRRAATTAARDARLPTPPRRINYHNFDDLPILDGPSADRAEYNDPLAGLNLNIGDGVDEDGRPVKKRRVMAKIDAERLMSDNGFPALMKAAKKFKAKGKGHETSDLKRILEVYQMWAHGMFPKGDFAGTISRVETVCRTRRMEMAMKGYREAFYPPPPRSPSPPGLSPLHTSPPLPDQELPVEEEEPEPRRSSQPPLFDGGDDPDLDELMAMEEMERTQERASATTGRPNGTHNPPEPDPEDEWEGLYD